MIPAWRSSDVNLIEVLKATSRGVRTGAPRPVSLIAAQIALTLALVAGTGLFVSSLARLRDAPLGFRAENVVEAQLFPAPDGYKNFTAETYYRELLRQIEALPGVESASYSISRLCSAIDSRNRCALRATLPRLALARRRTGFPTISSPRSGTSH